MEPITQLARDEMLATYQRMRQTGLRLNNTLVESLDREAHNGQQVSLTDFRGKQVVVLYFCPMNGTPVCTKEACGFRDVHEEFAQAGAAMIGVSADSLDRHRAFAAKHGLPFLLVSDEDGTLRKAYRVPKTLGLLPGRVTYVIDKQGVVRKLMQEEKGIANQP